MDLFISCFFSLSSSFFIFYYVAVEEPKKRNIKNKYKMEKSNNTSKLVGAVLVGAVIGGALGVLFAPDKGSVTRKKLMSKGEDLKDSISEKINGYMSDRKDGEMHKNSVKTEGNLHNA
jgi:hypothetical protein